MTSAEWAIEHVTGAAAALHDRRPAPRRTATFLTVTEPALVLGSLQPPSTVERRVAAALGIDVVSRRSGGGGVLVVPDECVWLDLVIPAGDPLWDDDVGRSMLWVGDVWASALAACGVGGAVHRGPLITSTWSKVICFAGVGTGEVMATGERIPAHPGRPSGKLAGIAQRRTREAAHFQTMCHLRWRPELVAALVAPPRPTAAAVASMTSEVRVDAPTLIGELTHALPALPAK